MASLLTKHLAIQCNWLWMRASDSSSRYRFHTARKYERAGKAVLLHKSSTEFESIPEEATMMKLIALAMALLSASLTSCAPAKPFNHEPCRSVDQVLSEIKALNGQEVTVCGVLRYEFEDRNLYANQRAARQRSDTHCLAIGLAQGFSEDLSLLSDRPVWISGTATSDFCPEGTLCTAACSDTGIFVKAIRDREQAAEADSKIDDRM